MTVLPPTPPVPPAETTTTEPTNCAACRAPLDIHCRSKHCPWLTCMNPACKTTWHKRLPNVGAKLGRR